MQGEPAGVFPGESATSDLGGGNVRAFTLGGGLVFDDGAADVLTGNAGRNWFIFNSRGGGVIGEDNGDANERHLL